MEISGRKEWLCFSAVAPSLGPVFLRLLKLLHQLNVILTLSLLQAQKKNICCLNVETNFCIYFLPHCFTKIRLTLMLSFQMKAG